MPALCWENSCFMLGKTLFSQLFQLYAGKILALYWQNFCLVPEFYLSRLQCKLNAMPYVTCQLIFGLRGQSNGMEEVLVHVTWSRLDFINNNFFACFLCFSSRMINSDRSRSSSKISTLSSRPTLFWENRTSCE